MVVLASIVVAILLYFYPEDPSQEPIIGPKTSSTETDGLVARAWIERNRVYSGQIIRLRITFDNRSGTPADITVYDVQTPGFEPETSFRFLATRLPAGFPLMLPAGASVTLESTLTPAAPSYGRFSLGIAYLVARPHALRSATIVLDPVEITSWYRERASLVANRAYSVIKDLTLPVILAALAYVFQRVQKDREMRQAIWTTQLPRMHEYAEKHYMPIVRSLRGVQSEYLKLRPTPSTILAVDDSTKRYSYVLLMFLGRMRALREDKGGVFFKDRGGEYVAQAAWYAFSENVVATIGEDIYESALKELTLPTTYEDFSAASEPTLDQWHAKLLDWINGVENPRNSYAQCLELLKVLQSVFSFEANRPFDAFWYERPADFDIKLSEEYKFPIKPEVRMQEFKKKLDAYYKDVLGYLKQKRWN